VWTAAGMRRSVARVDSRLATGVSPVFFRRRPARLRWLLCAWLALDALAPPLAASRAELPARATAQPSRKPRCIAPGCERFSSFGEFRGDRRVLLSCAKHREAHHVDLKNPRCEFRARADVPLGAGEQPSPAAPVELSGNATSEAEKGGRGRTQKSRGSGGLREHLLVGGCTLLPTFGFPGDRRARRCMAHRLPGQVRLKRHAAVLKGMRVNHNSICLSSGCDRYATFGDAREGKKLFCKQHCDPSRHVDVKNRACIVTACPKQPSHGLPGVCGRGGAMRALLCATHRDPMQHVRAGGTSGAVQQGAGGRACVTVDRGAEAEGGKVDGWAGGKVDGTWVHDEQLWQQLKEAAAWDAEVHDGRWERMRRERGREREREGAREGGEREGGGERGRGEGGSCIRRRRLKRVASEEA